MPVSPSLRMITSSVALVGVLSACSRATSSPADVGDQQISLATGESATIAGTTVRAVAINDSRCPSDVVCITAGDVVMVLAFSGPAGARMDTLRLVATPKTSTYGGLRFQPTTVMPYPNTRLNATVKTVTLHVTAAP
jgi:hypothetical protein